MYNISQIGEDNVIKSSFTVIYKGKTLTIPVGFHTDHYSTLWIDLADTLPAVAHDRAYKWQKWDDGSNLSRFEADEMLYRLMKDSKNITTNRLAFIYWCGVRLFGWFPWHFG